jgi:hypothetical protein
MLAQNLSAYGLLAGAAQAVTHLSMRADVWIDDWGFSALVVGVVVAGGWVLSKLFGREQTINRWLGSRRSLNRCRKP